MKTGTTGPRMAQGWIAAWTGGTNWFRAGRPEVRGRRSKPSLSERRAELARFYAAYEEYVDVLCEAFRYGPNPTLERQFLELRFRYEVGYGHVRPFLRAYLRYGEGDAFEALMKADDLRSLLDADDGDMLARVTCTREALNLYGEHLRQLALQTA